MASSQLGLPRDILEALDEEVALLTEQMSQYNTVSSPSDQNVMSSNNRKRGSASPSQRQNCRFSRDQNGINFSNTPRNRKPCPHGTFNLDLEVAEITSAFKPNAFRLGTMATRFKSGYLIDLDDGFDSSLPVKHVRNRYGHTGCLVNTPVAKGFFPINTATKPHGKRPNGEIVTSPSILKPKAHKVLSPLTVSVKDRVAVETILQGNTRNRLASPENQMTKDDHAVSSSDDSGCVIGQSITDTCHVVHTSDHDSGRSSGQSSEEEPVVDTHQKTILKGIRKENLNRYFRSFETSQVSEKNARTNGVQNDLGRSDCVDSLRHTVQETEIHTSTETNKKVTFNLSPPCYDYESDGFFSDDDVEDDEDDDLSSWTGSTLSTCSSCSCCSCCSCSTCSTCSSDYTDSVTLSDRKDSPSEIFFTEDDYLAESPQQSEPPPPPRMSTVKQNTYSRGMNCALNDVMARNDTLTTISTSCFPDVKKLKRKVMSPIFI
ncbi:uncharacterized protein LOC144345229 [Saccoglossus kowalevskii]